MTHPLNTFKGNKLDPEVKKQFVAALRSGEYEQGRLSLNARGCFCPLGVLTDLAVKAGVVKWVDYPWVNVRFNDTKGILVDQKVETCILSPQVKEWSGSNTELGDIRFGTGSEDTIMTLNDFLEYTFPEIADIVEERL